MLIKLRYSVREVLLWTRLEIGVLLAYATVIALLYEVVGLRILHLPWAPVAVVGTAVAFIVGFQNNAAYGRIWEARKIWGGIVNASRTWGMHVQECVSSHHAGDAVSEDELDEQRRALIHRRIAWLTSLRHAMRRKKPWETFDQCPANRAWSATLHIPEREATVAEEIGDLVTEGERNEALSRSNPAAAFLFQQSRHLSQLKDRGLIWEFSYLQMLKVLEGLFELQGKSERIKNFPYPRQYSTIARAIEIDLRELLGESGDTVPGPLKSLREVQM